MRTTATMLACALLLTAPAASTLADEAAAPATAATPAAPAAAAPAESSAPAGPAAPGEAAPAVAPAPAPASAAPAAGAPSATSSEPIKLGIETPPPTDFKPPQGYRAVKKGLETVYCKSQTVVGTRLPTQVCYSQEQVAAMEHQAELDRQMMHQKSTNGGTSGN
ncbi:MAG TPA: hypothetical protein PLR35_18525 [Burkholderiaceae bacterium]|nr:hypothetical protein [Burkholderiaceae bacterium]